MTERPILFSGPMVCALLDGAKTQTRRPVTPKIAEAIEFLGGSEEAPATRDSIELLWGESIDDDGKPVAPQWLLRCADYPEEGVIPIGKAPGALGDLLWVRETWQPLYADGRKGHSVDWRTGDGLTVNYPATDGAIEFIDDETDSISDRRRPSIHMPRWASRITLRITDVRIERVQDISEEAAEAEGFGHVMPDSARTIFARGWDILYAKRGFGWDANPWVWAITFVEQVAP